MIRRTATYPAGDSVVDELPAIPTPTREQLPPNAGPRVDLRLLALLRVSDAVAVTASALMGAVLINYLSPIRAGDLTARDVALAIIAMIVALHLHGMHRRPASVLRPSGWWRATMVARCLPTAALLALGVDALISSDRRMTLTAAVAMTLPAVLLVPLGRRAVMRILDRPTVSRVLIVGAGPISDRLTSRLRRCRDTLIVGTVDDTPTADGPVLGRIADLPEVCEKHRIDRVIIAYPNATDADIQESVRHLGREVPVSIIPRFFELLNWRSGVEELHGLTLVHVPVASLAHSDQVVKRAMDVVLATLAVIAVAPLWLVIAIAIKVDSPGPVFFRQVRIGRGGRPFQIFKFRSMTADADAVERRATVAQYNKVDGPLFKAVSDPRVTRVGAIIRKTSFDELPQFLNVIRGDMSIVGPRPLPTEMADGIDGAALARLDVSPGITGLWQVCGRSDLSYADLQHLDSVYVRSWSLLWDLRIMLQTPAVVLQRKGAY